MCTSIKFLGSGDYDDEYYDDYDEYNDEDDLGDVETNPPASKKPITLPANPATTSRSTTTSTTSTTTTTLPTSTHPHRHHHGEVKPSEDRNPDDFEVCTVVKSDLNLTSLLFLGGTRKPSTS